MNKSVSGIKRSDRRSVRDIGHHDEPDNGQAGGGDSTDSNGSKPPRQSRNQRAATYGMWFIGLVIVLLLFFLFSVVFARTTVNVTPRTAPISVDNTFTAERSGTGTSSAGSLNYSVVTVSETATEVASSSGSEYKEARARGEITVYNEYSQDSLQLVDNTRFQSPDGNVYRTQSAATVPGGSAGSPGKTTVSVTADQAGARYNQPEDVRFSVPGFAGMPQEGKVYAQLSTPITGGIAKEVPAVGTSTKQQVADRVSNRLQSTLQNRLTEKISDSLIGYEPARFFSTDVSARSAESGAEISVVGTLKAVVFDRRGLSIFLAENAGIDVAADTNARVQDLNDFSFAVANPEEFTPGGEAPLEFQLSGESLLVWQYNKQALARDLQSLQKNQINDVLKNYPSIQSATINTRPFWKRSLPSNPEEIIIKTKQSE
jgi:hypothetical protein